MQGSFSSSINGNQPSSGPGFKSAQRIGGNLAKAGHSISGFSDASSSRNQRQGPPGSKQSDEFLTKMNHGNINLNQNNLS